MSTQLALFTGADQRNFLLIGLMLIAPLAAISIGLPRSRRGAVALTVPIAMMTRAAVTDETAAWSSVLYTTLFVMSFAICLGCLDTGQVTRDACRRALWLLIFAYAVVSVLQAAADLTGLPVPNQILSKGSWSYNSLAAEPSHVARILPMALLTYFQLGEAGADAPATWGRVFIRDGRLLLAFMVAMYLSGSVLALLLIPLTLLLVVAKRSGILVLLLVGAIPFVASVNTDSLRAHPELGRLVRLMEAAPEMDATALAEADTSGATRLTPVLIYFESLHWDSWEALVGGGHGAMDKLLRGRIAGMRSDAVTSAGFFPGFAISYGLIGLVLALSTWMIQFLRKENLTLVFLWLVASWASAWNSQTFWFGLLMIAVVWSLRHEVGDAPPRREEGRAACAY
ncbi:hypothetical protein N9L90_00910 [Planctomycetota bacterium]|nr:hypothetical protein [Planctomycetota bacterium]